MYPKSVIARPSSSSLRSALSLGGGMSPANEHSIGSVISTFVNEIEHNIIILLYYSKAPIQL